MFATVQVMIEKVVLHPHLHLWYGWTVSLHMQVVAKCTSLYLFEVAVLSWVVMVCEMGGVDDE